MHTNIPNQFSDNCSLNSCSCHKNDQITNDSCFCNHTPTYTSSMYHNYNNVPKTYYNQNMIPLQYRGNKSYDRFFGLIPFTLGLAAGPLLFRPRYYPAPMPYYSQYYNNYYYY